MNRFVIHEHHTSKLFFELSIQVGRNLRCWAIPKGIPIVGKDRRLAVEIPSHPLDHLDFQGPLPYGRHLVGHTFIWDTGHYDGVPNLLEEINNGSFTIDLHGTKIDGAFSFTRVHRHKSNWHIARTGTAVPLHKHASPLTQVA